MFRDLWTLYNILFASSSVATNADHAAKLEAFYKPQIADYDRFREKMLWGRVPLLHALVAHFGDRVSSGNLVWIDFGGGTGYNVEKMAELIPLDKFKRIYVVDLCPSMCAAARDRAEKNGWSNVEVVAADAASFDSPDPADFVTFSYSLSMIPNFYGAVDNAHRMLKEDGIIGMADFIAPPDRSWLSRTFWAGYFDFDNVKLGPERRQYAMHKFHTYYEFTHAGTLPYVPSLLKVPYYLWIGTLTPFALAKKGNVTICKSKAPPMFPPTFLYHQSWEDPAVDAPYLDIKPTDTCLTLTSGGCNTLELLIAGAKMVVSVDVNPAQTALLELKSIAIQRLNYQDFWLMFGEGVHPNFAHLYDTKLAPFLSQASRSFWELHKHYFTASHGGLYSQGSMGKLSVIVRKGIAALGMSNAVDQILNASSLERQRTIYNQQIPSYPLVEKVIAALVNNNIVSWFAGGVPAKQLQLIKDDGLTIIDYCKRVLHGIFNCSYIRGDNYFYFNILTGRYAKDNCPAYLLLNNFATLRDRVRNNLCISNDYFINELRQRTYDKIVLMDHADWQTAEQTIELAAALYKHTSDNATIILRSAAYKPPYIEHLRAAGFEVRCIQRMDQTSSAYMDRVNMYASFWVCKK